MCEVFAGQDPERYGSTTRRLRLNGQSTSIRLENAFWATLDDIAARDGVTTPVFISTLHSEVLERRGQEGDRPAQRGRSQRRRAPGDQADRLREHRENILLASGRDNRLIQSSRQKNAGWGLGLDSFHAPHRQRRMPQ